MLEATMTEARCREIVSLRSKGLCEKCGNPGRLEKAHRVARSKGGQWMPSNILDPCHTCTSRARVRERLASPRCPRPGRGACVAPEEGRGSVREAGRRRRMVMALTALIYHV